MIRELIKLLISGQGQVAPAAERRAKWTNATAVETRVKEIIAEVTGVLVEEITPELHIYRIGSSNDEIEVIMQCEEDFGIEIPDGEAEQCETVGKLATYINKRLSASSA